MALRMASGDGIKIQVRAPEVACFNDVPYVLYVQTRADDVG